MEFKEYLQAMVERDASDLYLSTGALPSCKIHGQMVPLHINKIPPGRVKEIA